MFDWKKPTVEMLGRWQPWHDGHTELFRRALQKTGQVCIMYRDVAGVDAGVEGQADNPFDFEDVKKNISNLPFDAVSLSKSKEFEDTNKVFETLSKIDTHVKHFMNDEEIKKLAEELVNV